MTTAPARLRGATCGRFSLRRPLRPNRTSGRTPARGRRSPARGAPGLTRQRLTGCRSAPLTFQGTRDGARSRSAHAPDSASDGAPGGAPRRGGAPSCAALRGPRRIAQGDAGATGLRQSNRDRLLGRTGAVFPLTDVVHFLADEFARLGRRGLAGAPISPSACERGFLWHELQLLYVGYPDLIGHGLAGSVPE